MASDHPYLDRYKRFFRERDQAEGYEFHQAPVENVPPPKVTFRDRLRWWTWNRQERIKKIREDRDRRQQDILNLKGAARSVSRSGPSSS